LLSRGDIIDGKYLVARLIGEGGMGAVYEGVNLRLQRPVAIKVMHASMARDRDLVRRFEREARAAAKIGSKHIADVLDLGDLPDGDRFMIMEYLDGESLSSRLKKRGRITPHEAAGIGIQLLEGLIKVHEARIVHRDLKPANIFLAKGDDGRDFVKILDFGICKVLRPDPGRAEVSTGIGDIFGTLAYMCPEHIEHGAKALDERSDLYAVGVILYRCVAGRVPFQARDLVDLLRQLREGHTPSLREIAPELDRNFVRIVDKAIEWERKARFQTAADFQSALVRWSKSAARIDALLTDFLKTPMRKRAPSVSAFPDNEPITSRYAGADRDALLLDANAAALEDLEDEVRWDVDHEPEPAPEPITHPRRGTRTSRMRSAPTRPGSRVDDDEVTLPKHVKK
jgi:serine/threonine-protein kinase